MESLKNKLNDSREARLTTSRKISSYEKQLRFSRELLRNKTVLNLGCGGSNIKQDLTEDQIQTNVVELDLKFNPGNSNLAAIAEITEYIKSKLSADNRLYKLAKKIRESVDKNIKNRDFTQANGRFLPFAKETFDFCMALWSTYQVPDDSKEAVFREMMRVSNIIHLGPIFKKDYNYLTHLSEKLCFDIVICHPFAIYLEKPDHFTINNLSDYAEFINKKPIHERVIEPEEESPELVKILPIFSKDVYATSKGGSFMVLKRNEDLLPR